MLQYKDGKPHHSLKILPGYFESVIRGVKTYEVRSCEDREFNVNEVVRLCEYDPTGMKGFTGRFIDARIAFLTPPRSFGLPSKLVVFGITELVWGPGCCLDDKLWAEVLDAPLAVEQ